MAVADVYLIITVTFQQYKHKSNEWIIKEIRKEILPEQCSKTVWVFSLKMQTVIKLNYILIIKKDDGFRSFSGKMKRKLFIFV